MINLRKILLSYGLTVFASFTVFAQISLVVSDATADQGDDINVGVEVVGFNDVASMQFSLNWDSTALKYKAIENLTDKLPDFTSEQLGLLEVSAGILRVAWLDNGLKGVSMADSTKLFSLKFEVIGEAGSTSSVSITDDPIPIEFTDANSQVIEIEALIKGDIIVPDESTSIRFLEAHNGMRLFQNEPNPFKNTSRIMAYLPTGKTTEFFITDALGKIVYRTILNARQGEHIIDINRNNLNIPGTYYYTLKSAQYQLSKKLILIP